MAAIKDVQIFGERCSGTNYLERLIQDNFEVQITWDFGFKHWFIKGVTPRTRINTTTDLEPTRTLDQSDNTLFLILFRNPCDWLRSMHRTPHQTTEMASKSFSEFLREPWISQDTVQRNPKWRKGDNESTYFIEEAENILHLRTMKNQHFLNVADVVKNCEAITYEDLKKDPQILRAIAKKYNIRLNHRKIKNITDYKQTNKKFKPKQYELIGSDDLAFIKSQLDLDVEAKLGYFIN